PHLFRHDTDYGALYASPGLPATGTLWRPCYRTGPVDAIAPKSSRRQSMHHNILCYAPKRPASPRGTQVIHKISHAVGPCNSHFAAIPCRPLSRSPQDVGFSTTSPEALTSTGPCPEGQKT